MLQETPGGKTWINIGTPGGKKWINIAFDWENQCALFLLDNVCRQKYRRIYTDILPVNTFCLIQLKPQEVATVLLRYFICDCICD